MQCCIFVGTVDLLNTGAGDYTDLCIINII